MWKVTKWVLSTIWTFVLGLVVFIFHSWIFGRDLKNLPQFFAFLSQHKLILVSFLLGLWILIHISFHKDTVRKLQEKVLLYKPISRLKPSDINPSKHWYDHYFLERLAVNRAVDMLTLGQGVIFLGVPLIGKTRCAYEALKQMRGYHVLGLKIKTNQDVTEIKIPRSYLLHKPKLILFLDDLQLYIENFSPLHLYQNLLTRSQSITILATCRLGEEYCKIESDKDFGSFVRQILQPVHPELLSKYEEKDLADHFGKDWSETSSPFKVTQTRGYFPVSSLAVDTCG